jgi:hypothetical protein
VFIFFPPKKNVPKFENLFTHKGFRLFVPGNNLNSFLKIFYGSLLVLLRCVRVVLIARRGAGGVYPVQPTMQNMVTKIRAPKRLKKKLEFLSAKQFV